MHAMEHHLSMNRSASFVAQRVTLTMKRPGVWSALSTLGRLGGRETAGTRRDGTQDAGVLSAAVI